jgi:pyruvate formate lyase activating enzyme
MNWRETHHPARLEERLSDGVVRCNLSPRRCTLKPGQKGFCNVRANRDGRLVTLNYGKGLRPTEEVIETEAVFHYAPSEAILSLGNIGCMLNCDYCQNWKTSQVKWIDNNDVVQHTPEQIVQKALDHNIRVLSWTYNDPVVWQEFVLETAALAKSAGIKNLYKSAFYITPEAVDELLEVIDIFSLSIKSINADYYRKLTKGRLEPVLEATRQVYASGKHLEISTLMVTDLSDSEKDAREIAGFILNDLGPEVPLHFVRFHPDYKLIDTVRTPIDRLTRARKVALDMGVHNVYLGNVYDQEASSSYCRSCNAILVHRFGLSTRVTGLGPTGKCVACGEQSTITLLGGQAEHPSERPTENAVKQTVSWRGEIRSAHIQLSNSGGSAKRAWFRPLPTTNGDDDWRMVSIGAGEEYRFMVSQNEAAETGVQLALDPSITGEMHEIFDRAHFPTVTIDNDGLSTDSTPLPRYKRP